MDDPTWADAVMAWAAVATAIATIALTAAAVIAGVFAYRQVRAAERHLQTANEQVKEAEEARRDALRPVLRPGPSELIALGGNALKRAVRVSVLNIGPGPAINVQVQVWVLPQISTEEAAAGLSAFSIAAQRGPLATATIRAVAAGQNASAWALPLELSGEPETIAALPDLSGREHALLGMALEYRDIYGRKWNHPQVPEGENVQFEAQVATLAPREDSSVFIA